MRVRCSTFFSAGRVAGLLVVFSVTVLAAGRASVVTEWNQVATAPDPIRTWGPAKSSGGTYVLALMHAAMRDAIDEAMQQGRGRSADCPDPALAGAAAARRILVVLFPDRADEFARVWAGQVKQAASGTSRAKAESLGRACADAWLESHGYAAAAAVHDGDDTSGGTGLWCHGAPPFMLRRSNQFRAEPPPLVDGTLELQAGSAATARAVTDQLAADELAAAIVREHRREPFEQFWNRVARQMIERSFLPLEREASLFALLNAALADACLAAEDSQTFYQFGTWTAPITRPPPGMTGVIQVPGVVVVQASVPNFPELGAVAGGAATAVLTAWGGREAALPVVVEHDGRANGAADLRLSTLGQVYAYLPVRSDPGQFAACRSGYDQGAKIGRWIASRAGNAWREPD